MIRTIRKPLAATTALTSIIIALAGVPAMAQELEIYQADGAFETSAHAVSADGSVVVPEVLRPYLGGTAVLKP